MSLCRCIIILSLFAWFAYARRNVDCERFPFHSDCRGAQTRKRFVNMEDNKFDENGYRLKPKLTKDNILDILSLLRRNGDTDDSLDALLSIVERRKNNSKRISAKDRNRIRRTQDFLSQLNSMDNDY